MSRKSRRRAFSETQWPALGYPDGCSPVDIEEKLFDRMIEWMEALGVHPAAPDAVSEAAHRLFAHVVDAGIPPERLTADHGSGPFEVRFAVRGKSGPRTSYFSAADVGKAVRLVVERRRGQTIDAVLKPFVARHAKGKSEQARLLKALRRAVDWQRFRRHRRA